MTSVLWRNDCAAPARLRHFRGLGEKASEITALTNTSEPFTSEREVRVDGQRALVPGAGFGFRADAFVFATESKCRPAINIQDIALEGFASYRLRRGKAITFR